MELQKNRFKQQLADGQPQCGLWLGIPNTTAAEIAACAGFDWLLIDHEHAPFELSSIISHLQAIAPYPVAPIVRPADDNPTFLKKLLDAGVQSFLIPMVETAQQAQQLVQALRYPPLGRRGVGTSLARAANWGQITDYLFKANREICLIVQIETVTALKNLKQILSVDGVDGVFIGPSDLAASMGYVGNTSHPDVIDAINNCLSHIKAAGKYAGLMCLEPKLVADYVDQGADFVGIGVDTLILSQGAQQLRRSFVPS